MITVDKSVKLTNGSYTFPLPAVCPHCSRTCTPDVISYASASSRHVLLVLRENGCSTPFLAVYLFVENEPQLLIVYPSTQARTFDDLIVDTSSRFVDLYNQAYAAEQLGSLDLAGAGYRNALEVLIKDFAINVLGEDESVVSKKKLYKAIEDYYPHPNTAGLPQVVRDLGNDYTHYQKNYSETDFAIFKAYLDGAIMFVQYHLMAANPPAKDSE